MAVTIYLFDAEQLDRELTMLDQNVVDSLGDHQLLWIDITGANTEEDTRALTLLRVPTELRSILIQPVGESFRPRLDLYGSCFHLNVRAVQERSKEGDQDGTQGNERRTTREITKSKERSVSFQFVMVHFVVFEGVVLTLHETPVEFLNSFDRRFKGDTHFGGLDSSSFLGALLNWHITGYFRAMESLETEVDTIDDNALLLSRGRGERDLLRDMVRVRRRLALVRRALLPHREVYATLARSRFAPFVPEEATVTLRMLSERLDRAIESTENARELILGSFDIFSTQTALRTNEVVKTLTVISALLLPAGVIINLAMLLIRAPVYDEGRTGFWVMLGGMLVGGTGFVLVARKRRWL